MVIKGSVVLCLIVNNSDEVSRVNVECFNSGFIFFVWNGGYVLGCFNLLCL